MITKLKWLKAYFLRNFVAASGVAIGKIFYTAKNTTDRRKQYVIDLDTKKYTESTIDPSPADLLVEPGAIYSKTNQIAPSTDSKLYVLSDNYVAPVLANIVYDRNTQTIAVGQPILAIELLSSVSLDGGTVTAPQVIFTAISSSGLTLNTTTGVVTLNSNAAPGIFTLNYRIAHNIEPSIFVTGTTTVTVTV